MAATNKARPPARRDTEKPAAAQVIPMLPVKAAAGSVQWVRRKPVERVPVPVAAAVYAVGAIGHQVGFSPLHVMLGTVSTAGVGYIAVHRRTGDERTAGLAAAATMAAGSWIAAAAEFGVLWGNIWGPVNVMTMAFLAMYLLTYRRYRADDRFTEKVEHREDQIWWMQARDGWKLPNSLLISRSETRLGEKYVINIMGTGMRASQLASRSLEEHIAAIHKLPRNRVKVREGRSADRIEILIRFRDPWAKPITHPLLDEDPEIQLPAEADVRDKIIIGQDPETGKPLEIEMVDPEEGANRVMVVGISGGGKTVLVNNILERLTACNNAMVCCIDLVKGKEMRRFRRAGALGPSALGPRERKKALAILRMARAAVEYRSEQSEFTDDVVHEPRPGSPAIFLILDEVDALFEKRDGIAAACAETLTFLLSKGRSENVVTMMIGQRGTAKWMGGANARANFNVHVFLKVDRQNEQVLAAGPSALAMPDMSNYGEGHAGVAMVVKKGNPWTAGRTFLLRQLTDLDRLAEGRAASDIEPGLKKHLGKLWVDLTSGVYDAVPAGAPAMAGGGSPPPGPETPPNDPHAVDDWLGGDDDQDEAEAPDAPGDDFDAELAALDASVEAELPADLREQMEQKMNRIEKNLNDARERNANRIEFEPPTPEQREALRRSAEERRRQYAEQTEISPGHMKIIMGLLGRPEGAAASELMEALGGMARTSVWRILVALRERGQAHSTGRGRGTRWHAGPAPDAGGGHGQ